VLDPHKFLTLIPLCFFWYIILFLFPDLQNPLFSTISVLADFAYENCTAQVVGSDDVAASDNIGVLNGTPG